MDELFIRCLLLVVVVVVLLVLFRDSLKIRIFFFGSIVVEERLGCEERGCEQRKMPIRRRAGDEGRFNFSW